MSHDMRLVSVKEHKNGRTTAHLRCDLCGEWARATVTDDASHHLIADVCAYHNAAPNTEEQA